MKKLFLFLVVAFSFATSYAQSAVKVPAIVQHKFDSLFPAAKNTKWMMRGVDYEADFSLDIHTMKAIFAKNGIYIQKELMIDQANLPEAARNYILTHDAGKNVLNVYKITRANGQVSYTASVGGKKMTFDAGGNYVAPAKAPAAKAKPKK
ncbi:MAG: hypothetical protein HY064_08805 [Bacteroidetes bacterium]|nr:hypothetical protein [Bacteroidota bacterium]